LRQKASLPGVPLEYLRFVKGEDGKWTPAAGTFDGWPEKLAELKTLDPCCGSGHFLVAAFLMLVPMRMELEGLTAREAVDRVLTENIHGLEIDQRCVELAAFALALAAWRYPDAGGYRPLPELNVACTGLSLTVSKDEWKKLANGKRNLRIALDWLYDIFKQAPTLGSLLNPSKSEAANLVEWDELEHSLIQALSKEKGDEFYEMGVVAHGLARAARLLSGSYHWIITNVPYLGRVKQVEVLRKYCDKHHPAARNDLSTIFLERCVSFCSAGGNTSIVLPQNWLFLPSYKHVRKNMLSSETWNLVARLGPGAFETISGEVVKAILLSITHSPPSDNSMLFGSGDSGHSSTMTTIDVSAECGVEQKAISLGACTLKSVRQEHQVQNPDATVLLDEVDPSLKLLGDYSTVVQGVGSTDAPRFIMRFWEVASVNRSHWDYYQMAPTGALYSGATSLLRWENGNGDLAQIGTARKGLSAVGKQGFAIAVNANPFASVFMKHRFDCTAAVLLPNNPEDAAAICAFLRDPGFGDAARKVDQALSITESSFEKIPFDEEAWRESAKKRFAGGIPRPESNDPTQWIFHGHPAQSDRPLQVAVARLLGYLWPAELDSEMELSDEARALVARCNDLLKYADKDGIVCIPPVRGEASAADRLLNLLAAAYGDDWSTDKLSELLKQADHAGKTLDSWLRDKFFAQHCQLFHQRPFIWHIWDGLRDGFSVLVNYHKLDRKNLETLIYTYLGDWIKRQKDDISSGVDGAQERLAAAETLKKRLELILEGEAPYDIFVRWKPIEKQPIGWEPDLNDGVRLNIRPFMSVPDVKKKGAGILREKPKIHWKKDRGKDVKSAPWYHLFKGDRINDHEAAK